MKLAAIVAGVGLMVSLITIGTLVYNAGRDRERLAASLKHLCDQIVVLQKIITSEKPAYTVAMTWDSCQ